MVSLSPCSLAVPESLQAAAGSGAAALVELAGRKGHGALDHQVMNKMGHGGLSCLQPGHHQEEATGQAGGHPRELGQMALPAAWLLPDFSPGLWAETSWGPVTKWKGWGSVRASQSGPQELCVPTDRAAPAPGLAEALLHLFLLPGNCFPCPTTSGELLDQFPSWGTLPQFSPPWAAEQRPSAALQAFGMIPGTGRRSQELWQ